MKQFKTESKRLLDLMINSIYTNKEIFLRELISNASDALDKLYLASLTNRAIKVTRGELAITLAFDAEARTITVSDNGIGMNKEELDRNLGTIAHSGSLEYKQEQQEREQAAQAQVKATKAKATKAKATKATATEATATEDDAAEAAGIIGQFGVGFYSGFMVAQHVRVVSKAYGAEEAWAWSSNGVDGYDLKPATREEQGTSVILTLKPDAQDEHFGRFCTEYELKNLVKRYSNYVRYPVCMEVEKRRELPRPEDAGEEYRPEWESYRELDTLNSMTPIWKRRGADVSAEDYAEFYQSDFHDYEPPAATFTLHAEGALNYDALLFIPAHAPYDFYARDFEKGLALYSSNVLIVEKCADLLSDHFGFVRGVVDSADVDLNISRETLQQNSQLRAMARRIEKKIVSELTGMLSNKRELYEGIYKDFGRSLKYGIFSSYGQLKDPLAELLLYYSARERRLVTLREYLDGAPEGQDAIYYAAGDDETLLAKMPMVQSVLERGFDVLLCTQDVDEFCMNSLADYDGKQLKNVASANLGLETEEERRQTEEKSREYAELFEALQEILKEKVSRVELSTRLGTVPSGISASGPVSLEMEKLLAAMPGGGAGVKSERVLELNGEHPVFAQLAAAHTAKDNERLALLAEVLYNQGLLVEGLPLTDPVEFVQALGRLLA